MTKLLSFLKKGEAKVFGHFFLFNFLLYAGIFLGRSIRDALFFSRIGAEYLPYVYLLNAVIMLFFGRKFAKWTSGKFSFKKIGIGLFLFCAAITILFATLFQLPDYGYTNWLIGGFYLLSEVPLFIMVVFIWILIEDYRTENAGQRLDPKIIGGGHLGIVTGGLIVLVATQSFNISVPNLIWIWALFILLELFVLWRIFATCQPIEIEGEDEVFDESIEEKMPFLREILETLNTIKKYKYTFLFAIATFCNFFIFGINDFMLSVGAGNENISDNELVVILAWATIAFGLISALVQFLLLTKIIKKRGIPQVNTFAAYIFIIAFSILLLTTNLFAPVKTLVLDTFKVSETYLFFMIILFVRFAGFAAEYLINQTVLPSIYKAIPDNDRETTRSFIEGTFVQIVFGITGLFLLAYDFIYQGNLDFLILAGFAAAVVMLIVTRKMIPENEAIRKISEFSFKEKLEHGLLNIPKNRLGELISFSKDRFLSSLFKFLPAKDFSNALPKLLDKAKQNEATSLESLRKLLALKNIAVNKSIFEEFIKTSGALKLFSGFSRQDLSEDFLEAILSIFNNPNTSPNNAYTFFNQDNLRELPLRDIEVKAIAKMFIQSTNKYGVVRAGEVLELLSDKKTKDQIAIELGLLDNNKTFILNFIQQIDEVLNLEEEINNSNTEPIKLEEVFSEKIINLKEQLFRIKQTIAITRLDQLKLTTNLFKLYKIAPLNLELNEVIASFINKNDLLGLYAFEHFISTSNAFYKTNFPELLKDLPNISNASLEYFDKIQKDDSHLTNLSLNSTILSSPNQILLWIINGNAASGILKNCYKTLHYRLKNKIEDKLNLEVFNVGNQFQKEFTKLYLLHGLESSNNLEKKHHLFLRKKENSLKETLIYITGMLSEKLLNKLNVEEVIKEFTSDSKFINENMLTKLEQIVPRDIFQDYDNYLFAETAHQRYEAGKKKYGETKLDLTSENLNLLGDQFIYSFLQKY